VIISNVSFPKIIENQIIEKSESCELMLPYLIKSIRQLEKAGADFIVIPCNTLHNLLPKIKQNTTLKILNLVDEVCKESIKFGKVGIIGSSKTVDSRIYENKGFEIVYPTKEEQKSISQIIIKIIRKESNEKDKNKILEIIKNVKSRGANKIILACTDISNLINSKDQEILDSQEILIKTVIKEMNC